MTSEKSFPQISSRKGAEAQRVTRSFQIALLPPRLRASARGLLNYFSTHAILSKNTGPL